MTAPLRLLTLGAHPADIFDQSGGTMAHHVDRGDWVGAAVLTHGARIHDKVIADDMFHAETVPEADTLTALMGERADVKAQETREACEILGFSLDNVFFLGADDAVLLVTEEMVRQVARLIRRHKPNVLITHYPLEDGGIASPHATTGRIVAHAVELAKAPDPGDEHPPHKVAQTFYFGIGAAPVRAHLWGSFGGFTNDVFIDITDVIDRKLAAIDKLVSQGYAGDYARKRIEASDAAFGKCVNLPYAEGFIRQRSTAEYHLPVSDYDLRASLESDHQTIGRRSYRFDPPAFEVNSRA